ncbi:unnamed protein product [Rotaria socialis]|uniref:Isopenicillin N synthase-like Fe(2+) 2OG dioxygenase domain-containing protein n=1 Tax=Rotaria socialis TaxID=392032 RepID=A0A818SXI8_9BILA|nr:unnamed protein product [Rotaria socialis]CAF4507057.1 unnamed protein product [Rotaria socialis]
MSLDIPVIAFYPFLNGTDEDREKISLEIEKLSPKDDLKEGFDLVMELPADDKDRIERGAILYGPNFWPDNLHGFRECIYSEFYLKMLSLEWINAKPIPNTFVVNIGDLMQRWTDDQFKSTIHRVINTSGTIRYSIPVFFGPNYFAEIKSLINNEKEKYEPILAGEYLTQRSNDTYQYRQNHTSST